MSGSRVFQRICKSASLDAAVARLSAAELAEVAEYLSGLGAAGGVPAQVFGMVSARLGGGRPGPGERCSTANGREFSRIKEGGNG